MNQTDFLLKTPFTFPSVFPFHVSIDRLTLGYILAYYSLMTRATYLIRKSLFVCVYVSLWQCGFLAVFFCVGVSVCVPVCVYESVCQ